MLLLLHVTYQMLSDKNMSTIKCFRLQKILPWSSVRKSVMLGRHSQKAACTPTASIAVKDGNPQNLWIAWLMNTSSLVEDLSGTYSMKGEYLEATLTYQLSKLKATACGISNAIR